MGNRGFVFLEVLLAVMIASVGLMAIIRSTWMSLQIFRRAEETIQSVSQAENEMFESLVKGESFEEEGSDPR
ncbi:MAG: prepilin-type N-terminal cleavage/methylation domain-containing protein [Candidatus Omnitrophica bacterium]|nr:prepilin-type N-terminal cleavage/methylation domain-containing protein [Candidatus Omnitrophota bacterium]